MPARYNALSDSMIGRQLPPKLFPRHTRLPHHHLIRVPPRVIVIEHSISPTSILFNNNTCKAKSHALHTSTLRMAVPPKFAAHKLDFAAPPAVSSTDDGGVSHTTHTMEIYLDYCCPFSGKIFRSLNNIVFPKVRANPAWAKNLSVVFRQQIQPWHPSSTLMHEAALAVLKLAPSKFWEFSGVLFEEQSEYFDVNVVNEKRNDTYKRLAKVAAKVGVDEKKFYDMLAISEKPAEDGSLNTGNEVTNDLKVITKMNRLIGVHVTPTVVYDGVVQDVSSGWNEDQWQEWLTKNVV